MIFIAGSTTLNVKVRNRQAQQKGRKREKNDTMIFKSSLTEWDSKTILHIKQKFGKFE